jgi:geranylgeranyl reductase family protein
MSTDLFDVIVIGGGVAGSSAAYELANAGLKIIVLEKEELPRYKTCGGGVVLRAANLLPFKIDQVVQNRFSSADVYDQENKIKFRIERKEPAIFMVMRSDFDNFILSRAVEKGAVVKDQAEVNEIIFNDKNVEARTHKQVFKSMFVIACDGATGYTMSRFRLKEQILRVPAVESELFVKEETFRRLSKVVRFDFGFVPHGYGWVFPKKDHLSIGVAFMRKVNQSIQNWFSNYLKLLEINPGNIFKNERHGYVIPLIRGKVNCCSGRILFAGDNLGFADPLTAEGISYAIETAQLAARTIVNNYPDYSKVTSGYKSAVERVYREIRAARFLSKVVYGPPSLRKFIFRHWGIRLSDLLTDVIANEKKYSEIVRDPMNYLKLFRPEYIFRRK